METSGRRKIGSFVLKRITESDEDYISDSHSFSDALPAKKKINKTESLKEKVENMRISEFFNHLPNGTRLRLVKGKFNPAKRWVAFTWGRNTFEENLLTFEVYIQVNGIKVLCRFTAKMWKHTSEATNTQYLIKISEDDEDFVVENWEKKHDRQYGKSIKPQKIEFVSEESVYLPDIPVVQKPSPPSEIRKELIDIFFRDEEILEKEMTNFVKDRYTSDLVRILEEKFAEKMSQDASLFERVEKMAIEKIEESENFQRQVSHLLSQEKFKEMVTNRAIETYKKDDDFKAQIRPKMIESIKKEAQFRSELKEEIRKETEEAEKMKVFEQKMASVQRSIQKDPRRAEKTIMGPVIEPELELLSEVVGRVMRQPEEC
jgi:hypothetical protein